jgi:NADH:ubiquinone oxidoreductase subunit 3 (subunit A)/NADH:ubiquinone oxidoreductase subunit 6 (subunit J)
MELFFSIGVLKLLLPIFAIIAAIFVITTKNAIISVFNLIVLYILVAFYLIYLGVTYIGLSYIIIYIGAIAILFLFVIMMIDIEVVEKRNNNYLPLLFLLFGGFIFTLKNILYNIGIIKMKSFTLQESLVAKPALFDLYLGMRTPKFLNKFSDEDPEEREAILSDMYDLGSDWGEINLEEEGEVNEKTLTLIYEILELLRERDIILAWIKETEDQIEVYKKEEMNSDWEFSFNNNKINKEEEEKRNAINQWVENIRSKLEKIIMPSVLEEEINNIEGDSKTNDTEVSDLVLSLDKSWYNYDKEHINYLLVIPNWDSASNRVTQISSIGDVLYTVFHPFIYIISVLLLLGMLGAIILTSESNQGIITVNREQKHNYGNNPERIKKSGFNIPFRLKGSMILNKIYVKKKLITMIQGWNKNNIATIINKIKDKMLIKLKKTRKFIKRMYYNKKKILITLILNKKKSLNIKWSELKNYIDKLTSNIDKLNNLKNIIWHKVNNLFSIIWSNLSNYIKCWVKYIKTGEFDTNYTVMYIYIKYTYIYWSQLTDKWYSIKKNIHQAYIRDRIAYLTNRGKNRYSKHDIYIWLKRKRLSNWDWSKNTFSEELFQLNSAEYNHPNNKLLKGKKKDNGNKLVYGASIPLSDILNPTNSPSPANPADGVNPANITNPANSGNTANPAYGGNEGNATNPVNVGNTVNPGDEVNPVNPGDEVNPEETTNPQTPPDNRFWDTILSGGRNEAKDIETMVRNARIAREEAEAARIAADEAARKARLPQKQEQIDGLSEQETVQTTVQEESSKLARTLRAKARRERKTWEKKDKPDSKDDNSINKSVSITDNNDGSVKNIGDYCYMLPEMKQLLRILDPTNLTALPYIKIILIGWLCITFSVWFYVMVVPPKVFIPRRVIRKLKKENIKNEVSYWSILWKRKIKEYFKVYRYKNIMNRELNKEEKVGYRKGLNYIIPFFVLPQSNMFFFEDIKGLLFFFVIACVIIGYLLFSVNTYLSTKNTYTAKGGGFECGFSSFFQTRERYNVIFYRVALLFLLFDLEIILIFPFTAASKRAQSMMNFNILAFLYILIVGFIFELKEDALNVVKKPHAGELSNDNQFKLLY